MKFQRRDHRARSLLVDLTPMIDVVFLLIVFFLTTAQFARLTRADVELPKQPGEGIENTDETGVVINVLADGSIVIDDETLSTAELRSLIETEISQVHGGDASKVRVLLRADATLPARRINEIVRLLRDLGVGVGRFATEIPR